MPSAEPTGTYQKPITSKDIQLKRHQRMRIFIRCTLGLKNKCPSSEGISTGHSLPIPLSASPWGASEEVQNARDMRSISFLQRRRHRRIRGGTSLPQPMMLSHWQLRCLARKYRRKILDSSRWLSSSKIWRWPSTRWKCSSEIELLISLKCDFKNYMRK